MARTEVTGAQIKDATVDLTVDVTGTLAAGKGGTGNATNTLNNVLLGNGTGALQAVAPSTVGKVLRSDGTTWNSAAVKRAIQVSNTTSWTINSDLYDYAENTGLTGTVTINNPTGTPGAGQTLWIAVTGTAARAISYGTAFEASTVTLPTTTVTTARLDIGFIWNTATSKWRCVSKA